MDFPSITHLVSATFSEINSRGSVGAGPNDAVQSIAENGGFSGNSDVGTDSNIEGNLSNQSGNSLNAKA